MQELTARLADLCIAVDGPPMAYFEVAGRCPCGSDMTVRVEYVSLRWDIQTDDQEAAEPVLCNAFWNHVVEACPPTGDFRFLFWRSRPKISVERRELEVDAEGRTQEVCEDTLVPFVPALGPPRVALRARLAIPGVVLKGVTEGLASPTLTL